MFGFPNCQTFAYEQRAINFRQINVNVDALVFLYQLQLVSFLWTTGNRKRPSTNHTSYAVPVLIYYTNGIKSIRYVLLNVSYEFCVEDYIRDDHGGGEKVDHRYLKIIKNTEIIGIYENYRYTPYNSTNIQTNPHESIFLHKTKNICYGIS